MLRNDLELLLRNRILIIEGSLASEIQRRRKSRFPFTPRWILEDGELVFAVHKAFAKAGSHLLVTGTSEANRLSLGRENLKSRMEEINRDAVTLCRRAVSPDGFVFGGLGPTGALLKPYGPLEDRDYREIYTEQAEILRDAGVDGFILEGFSSLIEAEQCILALRELCSMPVIATMTFLEDGCTQFGDTAKSCFRSLKDKGADVLGFHGTLGPLEIDALLDDVAGEFPLCVRPNAGYPVKVGATTTYLSSPDYVAEYAEQFVEKGAVIVGGAAGFSPDHIREVARRLRGRHPKPRQTKGKKSRVVETGAESGAPQAEQARPLQKKLGVEPILSVELEPPRGLEIAGTIELLNQMKPHGVDAVNIPENPLSRARISSIALAKVIWEQTGIESIAHLTCRDRNLISLQAELLGAHVLGVNTILALTGDPSSVGDYPTATSIFDVDSTGLVEIMTRMNMGKDFGMNDLGGKTDFNIGVAANPLAENLDDELERLEAKFSRGANFIQTQPIFDPDSVEPFLKRVARFKAPVIFGVMPLRDYRHAHYLVNEYPGIRIPEADLKRMHATGPEGQQEIALELAGALIKRLKPMSGGVYLMPSFGNADCLLDILRRL